MDAETTFRFWLIALELLALLAFLGYPIARLAARWSRGALVVPAPLLGLSVSYLLSWYWVRATGLGLDAGVAVIVGVTALAWLPALRDLIRHPPSPTDTARAAVVPVVSVVAVAVLFTFHFSSVFRLDHLSSAAGSNIDVAAYSLVGGHLVNEGLAAPGNIYDYDLSARAESDAFGATALVGVAAVAGGVEAWEVGTAVLFVAILVLALSIAALIRRLWPGAGLIAAAAALVGVGGFLFVYLTLQFFLAQILGIALLCGLLMALLAALEADFRGTLAAATVVALLGAAMVSIYPHMAFFGSLVMLPAVAVCIPHARLLEGLQRLGVAAALGAVGAIVLAPDQFAEAVRRVAAFSNIVAGWPLPGFLPSDLAGAIGTDTPSLSPARWLGSALLLAGLVACAALRWRNDRLARFTVAAWAMTLASYAVVYLREGGESYRQWKWVTFFMPVVVALGTALVAAAALGLAHRTRLRPLQARAAALGVLAVVVALQTAKADPFISRYLGGATPGVYVSSSLVGIADDPNLSRLSEVSLNTVDPAEVHWVALLLHPRTILPYPAPAGAGRPWALERVGSRPPAQGVAVVPLNAAYQLSREKTLPPG